MWNPKWLWKNERIDERENKPTYAREKSSDSRNRQLENRDDRNQRKNDDSQYHDKTDIKMRITVLDNSTTNEEDILETEAHQLQ